MRNLKTLYVRNVLEDLIKKKVAVGIFIVICAVLFGMLGIVQGGKAVTETEEQKQEIEEYNAKIAEYDSAIEDTQNAIAEADKHPELTFGMMFNQRTNCVYRKMHEMVQSGKYGQIKRVNWIITDWYRTQAYYNSGGWRATWDGEGGGVLLNQCPHNLDLLQWICGMPSKVRAFCHNGKWHDIEVEDDVTAYLEFPNGATGVFVTTAADAPGTNRLEVTLEKGKLVAEKDELKFYELEINEREYCYQATEGFAKPPCHVTTLELDGKIPLHIGVLNAFAAAILRGEPLVADGVEGIHGLELSNAMHLSSWLEKPVSLPIDEDLFLEKLNEHRANSKKKENVQDITFDTTGSYGSKTKE